MENNLPGQTSGTLPLSGTPKITCLSGENSSHELTTAGCSVWDCAWGWNVVVCFGSGTACACADDKTLGVVLIPRRIMVQLETKTKWINGISNSGTVKLSKQIKPKIIVFQKILFQ